MPIPSWTTNIGTTTHNPAATMPVASPPSLRPSIATTPIVARPASIDTQRIAVSGANPSLIEHRAGPRQQRLAADRLGDEQVVERVGDPVRPAGVQPLVEEVRELAR